MPAANISIGRVGKRLKPLLGWLSLAVRPIQRPLFRAVLAGLLRYPGPFVSDVARGLDDGSFGVTFQARERRVLRLLRSPKVSMESLKGTQGGLVRAALPAKGRVFMFGDLSDLSKPYARTLPALDRVRDGSAREETILPGYWLNEVYVELEPRRVIPVVAELYSLRSGRQRSQTVVLLRGIEEGFAVTGSRGVFVADRQYDDGRIFGALIPRGRDFVIRLRSGSNSRRFLLPEEFAATVENLLPTFPLNNQLADGRILHHQGWLGWRRVRLPAHPDRDLTLIVAHVAGLARPLVLLTSLRVKSAKAARRCVAAYFRRWGAAEDSVRFLKQTFRMEKFLLRDLDAMKVWVYLQAMAMGILGFLLIKGRFRRDLLAGVESFVPKVRFAFYRAARAISEALQRLSPSRYGSLIRTSWP